MDLLHFIGEAISNAGDEDYPELYLQLHDLLGDIQIKIISLSSRTSIIFHATHF